VRKDALGRGSGGRRGGRCSHHRRLGNDGRRDGNGRLGGGRWSCRSTGQGALALEDGFERIAGLVDVREVDRGRFVLASRLASGRARGTFVEILADAIGLVRLDGAGVGLFAGDAEGGESLQNGAALHFQFARQIVDSNFTHPSSFAVASLPVYLCIAASLRRATKALR
jgi:hypothetical protein